MDYENTHQLGRLILKLGNALIKNRNHDLEVLGLTASQADSLQFFLENPQSTVTDLKDHLGVTHQTAHGLVQRIKEKNLVTLSHSLSDGRCRAIMPTECGKSLGAKMAYNRERTSIRLLSGMTEEEQKLFYRLLNVAYENIKNQEMEMLS